MPFNFDSNPLSFDWSDSLRETSFLRNCTCTSFIVISTLSVARAASRSRWSRRNRASWARATASPQKSRSASNADEQPVATDFLFIFLSPGSVLREVAGGASVSEPPRETLSPPPAPLTRSFVVIATARFRHRAFAVEFYADLPELAVVFRLVRRIGQTVERVQFACDAFIRAVKLVFALRAEDLAAGLLGQ